MRPTACTRRRPTAVAGFIGDSTVLSGTVRAADDQRCGMVMPDGRVLTGVNVNGARVGAAVEACIRPERIVLHREPPPERGNVLQVRIGGAIYFGDHLRLLCRVAEGQADATVKLALAGSTPPPRPGDDAWLELPPEVTRIYTV
jgi:putative spermidine/putrescine transport system ATP-binding protein